MSELLASGSAFGNSYTISRQGQVDSITGRQWSGILESYQFAINQLSRRVRWQGTMDFSVDVVTGASKRGLLPSMSWQYGYDDAGQWVHSASSEQANGIDLNKGEPDLGFFIYLAIDGKIKNYGSDVWIDPKPSLRSFRNKPSKSDDLASIITHELVHSMGVAYAENIDWSNRYTDLTVEREARRYFVGQNAVLLFGSDVPIGTAGDLDHFKLDNSTKKQWTIMGELGNYDISWRTPTALDFAILKDIGWSVI